MADTTTADTTKASVTVKDQVPEDFKPVFNKILDKNENMDRRSDQGIINSNTGSSILIRDDGQVNLSASSTAQIKLDPNGRAEEIALESITRTNRKNFLVDDFVINNHKLNPQLWEMADVKQLFGNVKYAAGGFTTLGTMLVKTWEPNLKRYVMMRRLCRVPIFSQEMNTAKIPDALKVADTTVVANTYDSATSKTTEANTTTEDSGSKAVAAAVGANTSTASANTKTDTKATDKQTETPTDISKSSSGTAANSSSNNSTDTSKSSSESTPEQKTADQSTPTTATATTPAPAKDITAKDVLQDLKTVGKDTLTSAADLTKQSTDLTKTIDSTILKATSSGTKTDTVASNTVGSSENKVIADITTTSKLLSKDLSLGTAAVDTQLTQIKADLVAKSLAENKDKTVEEKKAAAQLSLSAADKAFSSNQVSLIQAAAQVQTTTEAYLNTKVAELSKTYTTKSKANIYNDVYKQVQSVLKNDTSSLKSKILDEKGIATIKSDIDKLVKQKTDGVINNTIVSKIMIDINKEKMTLQTLKNKLEKFEQQEIAKVQAEAQKIIDSAISSVTSKVTSAVNSAIDSAVSGIEKSL